MLYRIKSASNTIFILSIILLSFPSYVSAKRFAIDELKRTISDSEKTILECPTPSKDVGVLIFSGQSNAGNHGNYSINKESVKDVFTFYKGKCYDASTPLLGASNTRGSFNSSVAQYLVDKGVYKKVIIANFSVGSSKIERWKEGTLISKKLHDEISFLSDIYTPDIFVWIHGESDNRANTDPTVYVRIFNQLMDGLKEYNIKKYGITLNTKCKNYNVNRNNLVTAHNMLLEDKNIYELGNLDELSNKYRHDTCHFNELGKNSITKILGKSLIGILSDKSL